jgi:hypothetical protein
VSPSGGGTISPPAGWYNSGTVVTVTAIPNDAYQFTGFSGDLAGTTTPQSLSMTGARNVVAAFAPACELVLDQPPNTPTVTRTGGNSMAGNASLRIAQHPAYGSWTLRVTAYVEFRTPGGNFGIVAFQGSENSVPAGAPIGQTFGALVTGVPLEPRGDGDYRITVSATGLCNGTWYTLTPNNPLPSPTLTVLRPRITTNGIFGMWWLGGISDPAGGPGGTGLWDQAQIVGTRNCTTGTCPSESLSYSITHTGSGRATLTCTSCDTTNAKAAAPSSYCNERDITVTANLSGFYAAEPVQMTVNTFRNARRITAKPPVSTTSAYQGGWLTEIFYHLDDLCSIPVNYPVSVNEAFGQRTPPSSQWLLPTPRSGLVIPFGDQIAVWPTQPGGVQPTPPQTPLGNLLVDQIPWLVRLGSQVSGLGLHVMTADQLRYEDHGDHTSNPAP